MFGLIAGRPATDQAQPPRLTTRQFIWLIDSLCRVHRRPFDAVRLVQRFPPPHLRPALVQAVRAHGFESRELSLAEFRPEDLPLPAIAFLRPVVAHGAPAVPTAPIPGLIAKCEAGRVLHVEACTDLPRTRFTRNFEEFFEPAVILAVPAREASL
jgi:subfamily B ATP-binding cassette protein HlyB/CyaB